MTSDERDEARAEAAKRRLRAALDGVELLPDTTSDERVDAPTQDGSREAELKRNVPPHHG